MLVLGRYLDQAILITHPALPEPIRVQVVRMSRNEVGLGIEAPDEVKVVREELVKDKRHAELSVSDQQAVRDGFLRHDLPPGYPVGGRDCGGHS